MGGLRRDGEKEVAPQFGGGGHIFWECMSGGLTKQLSMASPKITVDRADTDDYSLYPPPLRWILPNLLLFIVF